MSWLHALGVIGQYLKHHALFLYDILSLLSYIFKLPDSHFLAMRYEITDFIEGLYLVCIN
jgi:hypothetical protein